MKNTRKKYKNTVFQILLLSFAFTLLSAFIPFNSIDSDYSNITNNRTSNTPMALIMIECPEDITLSIVPFGCTASGELPLPTDIEGLCGGNEFTAETFDGGTLNVTGSLEDGNLSIFALDFEPGTHLIQYMVSDSCDNVFECEYEVIVPNTTIATVVVKQNIVIELSSSSTNGEATAKIFPESIDNGSFNPCNPIKMEIRRDVDLCSIPGNATYNADGHPNDGDPDPSSADYDSDDGQLVKFCCEDLTSTLYDVDGDGVSDIGFMKVWLRVWSDNNLDSIFGNENDTYNEAWTYVKVVDQIAPSIVCPPDITLKCSDDYLDPEITGFAEGFSSCGSAPVEYTDIIINIDACNVGFVRKRWFLTGSSDIFCDQTITVEDLDSPVNVSFPPDLTVMNCPDEVVVEEPTWTAGPCDVIGYTVDTDTFLFEDGACFKLVNHITVINWCDYKPLEPNWNGEGLWEHTQTVKVIDETVPVLQNCEDIIEVCPSIMTLTNVATDEGGEDCPTDWLKWQAFVDLDKDGVIDMEFSSFLPYFDDEFNDTNGNGIPDIYLEPTNSGEEVYVQLSNIINVSGTHEVSWKVTDGCNNVSTCNVDFTISDLTPPTAECQDTITVGVAQMEPSRLWAINYVPDVTDNCTSEENLRFTFSASPPEDDPSYDPDRRSSNYVMTLDDVDNGSVELTIYIWDENGNVTNCETVFLIDPDLILNTEGTEEIYANALHQNQPNPFRINTSVSFNLDRDTPVKLTFINATSANTLEIEIAGRRGLNTYTLDRDMLSGKGLYFYTMSTKYYRETKKMILIH